MHREFEVKTDEKIEIHTLLRTLKFGKQKKSETMLDDREKALIKSERRRDIHFGMSRKKLSYVDLLLSLVVKMKKIVLSIRIWFSIHNSSFL